MNIYEKIDVMFSGEAEDKPKWADDILCELREIKLLLQERKKQDNNFYDFIRNFRNSMKADGVNNTYPTYYYRNKKIGVDFKGLLYDKMNSKLLSKSEAFKVYRYAYNQQQTTKDSA